MAAAIGRSLETIAEMHGGDSAEDFSIAAWSTMVGALVLARVLAGDPRSDRILESAKSAVLKLDGEYRRNEQDRAIFGDADD